jgi:hypothetical protein
MSESALVSALVSAQAEMDGARKDSKNPHFKSTYASLESVVDAIKPALEKHGLAFIQKFHEATGGVAVETIILHKSGEQLSNGILMLPASKQDAQGYGSAITYARRYSLQSAFGIAPEDDDGNAACEKGDKTSSSQSSTKPKQPPTKSSSQTLQDAANGIEGKSVDEIKECIDRECSSADDLTAWWKDHGEYIKTLVEPYQGEIIAHLSNKKAAYKEKK